LKYGVAKNTLSSPDGVLLSAELETQGPESLIQAQEL
jgi:hypothetical protein